MDARTKRIISAKKKCRKAWHLWRQIANDADVPTEMRQHAYVTATLMRDEYINVRQMLTTA